MGICEFRFGKAENKVEITDNVQVYDLQGYSKVLKYEQLFPS